MYPGYFMGYPFKGYFPNRSLPFKASFIANHEIYEDLNGDSEIEYIHENWERLKTKNVFNSPYEANKIFWIKARFYGSPYFNGEQILHVSETAGHDENEL